MSTEQVTLYGYPTSPYVLKVKCFLDYKKIPFHWEPVRPVKNESIKFTGQKKVPVLKIGDEWRTNSTDLGIWLDELYREHPILGSDDIERETILENDKWVSEALIAGRFREALDSDRPVAHTLNGWRLAAIVNDATPIPLHWRILWPAALKKAPFIKEIVDMLDREEPIADMRIRHAREMVARLKGGPFLGARKEPSLADLSAFATLAFTYCAGFRGDFAVEREPAIMDWAKRMSTYLPENPFLCDKRFLKRSLSTI